MADTNKKERTTAQKWSRRAFIGVGGLAGLGLVVGGGFNWYLGKNAYNYTGKGFGEGHSMNAWVRIAPDNTITIAVPRAEMGQGVYTSVPMMIAEELEVAMSDIKIYNPQPEPAYANSYVLTQKVKEVGGSLGFMEKIAHFLPVVVTGGSTTIADGYNYMRVAGATAREMLIKAAAEKWGVAASDCYAENAHVVNRKNKEKLTYGELSEAAAKVKLAAIPELKAKKDWKILGKPVKRLDIPEKVTGKAQFGLDVRVEGMLYAVIRHATYHDGAINAVSNQSKIEGMDGVKKVVILPEGKGAVVVADNTWNAKNAALVMDFDETGDATLSTEKIVQHAEDVIANKIIATPVKEGDATATLDKAEGVISAKYDVPYLAHACMEPMNATVLIEGENAQVWVGHQGSSIAQEAASEGSGLSKENITIHSLYLGGGFGRRAEKDYVFNAAYVAKQMEGTPIQLVYTREEDMRHEMYRPYVASHFRAKLKDNGGIEAWENKLALQSVGHSSVMRIKPALAEGPEKDKTTLEGAAHMPYDMNEVLVGFGQMDLPIEVGNWRSVGNSYNGFFIESFIDECAHAAEKDPYQYRKSLISKHPRFTAVLDKVAEMSGWGKPLPEGKFQGISMQKSFGSIVAQVAEITKVGEKEFSIDKYYCVIDCGRVVNPDTVEAQMQSGIIYGLTAALYGQITFQDGEVEQYNFPQYEMIRMNVAPNIEVHIMDVDEYPGGVGEPATPPAPSAIANAIFAATGERIRSLPLQKHGYTFV